PENFFERGQDQAGDAGIELAQERAHTDGGHHQPAVARPGGESIEWRVLDEQGTEGPPRSAIHAYFSSVPSSPGQPTEAPSSIIGRLLNARRPRAMYNIRYGDHVESHHRAVARQGALGQVFRTHVRARLRWARRPL